MREIRLSPSAINDYQSCPLRYLYSYIYGLSPDREKDSLRIGTNWGKCHEIMGLIPQGRCPECFKREEIREDCYLCAGTGVLPKDLMDAVVRYLNYAYENVPDSKTHEQWEVERITLLHSFSGYQWFYSDSPFEIISSEIKYDLPVVDPLTHRKIPKVRSVGRIDHIIRMENSGLYYVAERKSTSRSLTTNRYWSYLQRNVQTVSYLWAARICQRLGRLENIGVKRDDPLIEGVFYDVWHKPDISPKMLSQADSKVFVESSKYYEEEFSVEQGINSIEDAFDENYTNDMCINGKQIKLTPGKKKGAFSIFETPQMFGARLLSDISERPEHYFARKEFPIALEQLQDFELKQSRLAKKIRLEEDKDLWICHEGSCETPFQCEFYPLCANNIKIGPNDIPEGFNKREEK